MQSAIGQHFRSARARKWAIVLGPATVAADMLLVKQHFFYDARLALSLTMFAVIIGLVGGDLESGGLRMSPKQGWRPWLSISVAIGLAVATCIVLGLGIWWMTGHEIPTYSTPLAQVAPRMLHMCIVAPVMEETVYRLILCVSLVSAVGCWNTIAVSGVLFGLLHVLYGTPSPENLVGGFFLAWAYLKSETILIPVLLHSIGNAIALTSNVAAFYLVHSSP